jgi:hypothetical protein
MKLLTTGLLTAGLLLGCLGVTAGAHAATPKPPKTAKFKASIKGEQTITWSYNTQPQAPCYGGENAGGSARMFYKSTKPTKVTAMQITKDNPLWDALHRRVVFNPTVQTAADVTIEGTHTSGPVPQPDQCDDNGGGVVPKPPECGSGTALINVTLGYVNKNRLLVQGDATSWDPGFEELRNLYGGCPYWQGGPYGHEQAEGDLTPADVKLKESQVFAKNGPKKITLHGSQDDCYEGESLSVCGIESGPFRGRIITTWTLTLKRIG